MIGRAWIVSGCLSTICIVLTVGEMVLFSHQQLRYSVYLVTQLIKTALWIILIVVSQSILRQMIPDWGDQPMIWAFVGEISIELCALPKRLIEVVMLLTAVSGLFIVALLYAYMVFRSLRRNGNSNETDPLLRRNERIGRSG